MTFPIIGLLGQAGSGKDVVADFFVGKGFVKLAFGDPMKRFIQRIFNFEYEQLWGSSQQRNYPFHLSETEWGEAIGRMNEHGREFVRDLGLPVNEALLGLWVWMERLYAADNLSIRVMLQTLGTEWGRLYDPLVWIKYTHQRLVPCLPYYYYSQASGLGPAPDPPPIGAVIVDHRFANEVQATIDAGGYMIRVHRPGRPAEMQDPGLQGHASEEEQKALPYELFKLELLMPEGLDRARQVLEDLYFKHPWSPG